jgi:hypothetical protein
MLIACAAGTRASLMCTKMLRSACQVKHIGQLLRAHTQRFPALIGRESQSIHRERLSALRGLCKAVQAAAPTVEQTEIAAPQFAPSWPARSHGCGSLREQDVGEQLTICGWVDGYRNHGGVLFVDVRDHTGILQVRKMQRLHNIDKGQPCQ